MEESVFDILLLLHDKTMNLTITEFLSADVKHRTGAMCSWILNFKVSSFISHTIIEVSSEPVSRYCECCVTAKHEIGFECPEMKNISHKISS